MPLYCRSSGSPDFGFPEVFRQMASGNTLLRNRGDGTFEDTTVKARRQPVGLVLGRRSSPISTTTAGWTSTAADGWVYERSGYRDRTRLPEQRGQPPGRVQDRQVLRSRRISARSPGTAGSATAICATTATERSTRSGRAAGTDLLLNSRGVAVADFWNRGVMDIAVSASTERHALLRNEMVNRRATGCRSNWWAPNPIATRLALA